MVWAKYHWELICLGKDCGILLHFFFHILPLASCKRDEDQHEVLMLFAWYQRTWSITPAVHELQKLEQELGQNLCMTSFFDNEGANVRWLYWDQLVLPWLVRDKMWPQMEKNSSQEIVKGFSPKTISCRSQRTLTEWVMGERDHKKNKKVSKAIVKAIVKEDIIWIKGTEGNKFQLIRSFLGTQKSPLQEKGSVLKTHLTPRGSQVQKELMLEDSASQVSSCFMTPDSQLQTWRDQHTQVDGEAEDKSKRADEKSLYSC